MPEYQREDLTINVGDRQFTATVVLPPQDKLARHPALLLTLSADRSSALSSDPHCRPANAFLKHGHRVVTFDMPCHGQRVDDQFGPDISGFRASFVAGLDPFKMCVEDGQAVITACIQRGWAMSGRIAVSGDSRCGYMVLRLLAADDRISVGAGLAPITDWRELSEFASIRGREDVAELRLTHYATKIAEKHTHIAIGKHDDRVSTAACQSFHRALKQAHIEAKHDDSWVEFKLTDDPGHSIASDYEDCIAFLLKWQNSEPNE